MMHRLLVLLLLFLPAFLHGQKSDGVRTTLPVQLAHAVFTVHDLPPPGTTPAPAVILLFTGKGDWTLWEDRVGGHLAKMGYYVLGIETVRYASVKGGDYAPDDFAADLERIVEAAPPAFVARNAPIFLLGRGLGAAAALGGAAVPPPPPRLAGLIVTDVPERGRYGYHLRDRIPFLAPGGEGTFTIKEAAAKLGTGQSALAVAQLHPDDGYFDTTSWLSAVQGPKKTIAYARGWKNFGVATPAFIRALDEAVAWQLSVHTLRTELEQGAAPPPAGP
ncbi:virulence protein (VirJ) [Verrucomicrobium sp. GAS474]|uniref:AcvB/VirJ family lysyl-phosphatidylglycerol hydrolase n=1 Tax=Verrucomicrobium sp. GAS474 TaxID=1882831 RepID=UPI000879BA5E|nr:AcvB/VirJ family lysyl-phosphatidylglycerol hydrolase [Verrucomicrobium sp. GAS474]SDT97735.1 virulence protein (VirJ) [Verrucomicrobium sp. GAS474]